jgi:aryl-alcohol dehydrogenase-like predicted oxidoreductase
MKGIALAVAAVSTGKLKAEAGYPTGIQRNIREMEWRNRQEGMEYRRLGDTGMMVSAMVIGAGGLSPTNYQFIKTAVDRGVNYVDTAWNYGNGESEKGVGELLKQVGRDKLFISTKLSAYFSELYQLCQDIYKGLPSAKQNELIAKTGELIRKRGVLEPGYHFNYFGSQEKQLSKSYLNYVIRKEYGYRKEWKVKIKEAMHKALNESLVRLGTDHVDILHCPHGVRLPEELEDETIVEVFKEMKQMGKARFLGVSMHSDNQNNLLRAVELGHYDMAMPAVNVVNFPTINMALRKAAGSGMGIISMKGARPVVSRGNPGDSVPQWRIDKLNRAVPGDHKLPHKAYLFNLQNPNIAGVISDFRSEEMIRENLELVGQKIEIQRI